MKRRCQIALRVAIVLACMLALTYALTPRNNLRLLSTPEMMGIWTKYRTRQRALWLSFADGRVTVGGQWKYAHRYGTNTIVGLRMIPQVHYTSVDAGF